MSLFKNLILHNFQVHRDLTYEFKDGFSTIVGPSDTGKSSIQRALYGIVYNDITKDQVTEGTSKGFVTLELNQVGVNSQLKIDKITCFITSGQKYYEVEKDGQTIRYEKLSGQPIKEFFQLGIINPNLEDLGINLVFQKQTDPMFLISDTKKTLSDLFNLSFGLDKYQQMSEHLKNKNKLLQNQINFIESEYNKLELVLEDNISNRDSFLEFDKQFTERETKVKSLQQSLDSVNQVLGNITKLRQLKEDLKKVEESIKSNKSFDVILDALQSKLKKQLEVKSILKAKSISSAQQLNLKLSQLFDTLSAKIVDYNKIISFIFLVKKSSEIFRLSQAIVKINTTLVKFTALCVTILSNSLQQMTQGVDSLISSIKQSNHVCKECGQLIGSGVYL